MTLRVERLGPLATSLGQPLNPRLGSISPYRFKLQLAPYLTPDTSVYRKLEARVLDGA